MSVNDESSIPSKKYFLNFNQNFTSLAVGTENGYKIFSLNSIDNLEQIHDSTMREPRVADAARDFLDVYILERLFCTNLVALVSFRCPRKLKVYHFKKGSEICNYSYSNTILAVKLNRQRLVVCLEENLHIHQLRDMKCLHTIRDTPPNPRGLIALSPADDNCYIAYPGSSSAGEVQIFDGKYLQNKLMIPAHKSPLAAMAFDQSGKMLATASEKGTVIRVFSVEDSTKLFEFRRAVIRNASIYSLTFSCDGKFLCTSSNTETVHIFKLEQQPVEGLEEGNWISFVGRMSASFLPNQVSEMWYQERSYATAQVPSPHCRKVAAISVISGEPRVLVATEDGYFYIFNLDLQTGGPCTLERTHKLDESSINNSPELGTIGAPISASYAAALKGLDGPTAPAEPASSQGQYESIPSIGDAASSPVYNLNDENDFPPMTHELDE